MKNVNTKSNLFPMAIEVQEWRNDDPQSVLVRTNIFYFLSNNRSAIVL
jgi:hypothetical protein